MSKPGEATTTTIEAAKAPADTTRDESAAASVKPAAKIPTERRPEPAKVATTSATAPAAESAKKPATESATPFDDQPFAERSSSRLRHVASLVLSALGVLVAYVGLDYASVHGLTGAAQTMKDGLPSDQALTGLAIGVGALLVAAAVGRLSPLGPLVVAVVLGALPSAWVLLRPLGFAKFLKDLPASYDLAGYGLTAYGALLFPVVTVLLLGAGVSGVLHRRSR